MNELNTRPVGIEDFKEAMVNCDHPEVKVPVAQYQVNGIYAREVYLPAGTLAASAKHKTEHMFVLSAGKVSVYSDNEQAVVYEAPFTGITKPGTERAVYAHEDSVWITFHATDESDVELICNALIEPASHPRLEQWKEQTPKLETK